MGISYNMSSLSKNIAKVPEEEFETHLEELREQHKEITVAGVERLVIIDERKTKEQRRESERKIDFQKAAAVGELPEG